MVVVRNDIEIKPSDYVRSGFKANGADISSIKEEAELLFIINKPTKEMMDAYTLDILNPVRQNDLEKVIDLHQSGILTMNCCNKFGESLLHLACRRGYTSIVRYLIDEVRVNVNIRDDYRRTPLHDACWTTKPVYDLVDMLIRLAPHQLLLEDIRGYTPFDYVRSEHQGKWLRFLWERKDILRPLETNHQVDITPEASNNTKDDHDSTTTEEDGKIDASISSSSSSSTKEEAT